ncbi:hypothetical protein WS66_28425 [Burkholderia sp. LA-2-3-30-S1-D2]|nr:hypothetical protein WS66_28425 [Burkholderia sp. LA-2-3-30-S1-D2]KVE13556.1 hypothetical protein WS66_14295 [Burkholderia sp. LA-2-3-30-S1-D2]
MSSSNLIRIRGARQYNLKNLDLDLRTGEMTVVTGPSGSGKSSLVFDTPEAENVLAEPQVWRFSTGLHDPDSDLRYAEPQAALFSFNSAYGACETCRGFGRVIGVDLGLVIPDARKTLRGGAIKPMQTPAWKECQDDLMRYAAKADIRRDTPPTA